ncbi:hypothetical protein C8J57DRAFT_1457807 [Mycena rebaudengoi]|nr:hypothetical protein C8J57DRAFT_1457807 [Mycena rebaudengoi]
MEMGCYCDVSVGLGQGQLLASAILQYLGYASSMCNQTRHFGKEKADGYGADIDRSSRRLRSLSPSVFVQLPSANFRNSSSVHPRYTATFPILHTATTRRYTRDFHSSRDSGQDSGFAHEAVAVHTFLIASAISLLVSVQTPASSSPDINVLVRRPICAFGSRPALLFSFVNSSAMILTRFSRQQQSAPLRLWLQPVFERHGTAPGLSPPTPGTSQARTPHCPGPSSSLVSSLFNIDIDTAEVLAVAVVALARAYRPKVSTLWTRMVVELIKTLLVLGGVMTMKTGLGGVETLDRLVTSTGLAYMVDSAVAFLAGLDGFRQKVPRFWSICLGIIWKIESFEGDATQTPAIVQDDLPPPLLLSPPAHPPQEKTLVLAAARNKRLACYSFAFRWDSSGDGRSVALPQNSRLDDNIEPLLVPQSYPRLILRHPCIAYHTLHTPSDAAASSRFLLRRSMPTSPFLVDGILARSGDVRPFLPSPDSPSPPHCLPHSTLSRSCIELFVDLIVSEFFLFHREDRGVKNQACPGKAAPAIFSEQWRTSRESQATNRAIVTTIARQPITLSEAASTPSSTSIASLAERDDTLVVLAQLSVPSSSADFHSTQRRASGGVL